MSDCRRGLASASMMARLAACSGSLAMTNALRESRQYFELPNKDAASGNRIHWWLATTPFHLRENLTSGQQLNGWEMSTARRAREMQLELVNAWHGIEDRQITTLVEHRLWYRTGLRPRFSGQPDFVVMDGSRALVINFKTGRLEAEPSSDNLQLRTEVVLLKHNFPELVDIEAAIVEPNVTWESERVRYIAADLLQAENQILSIVDQATWNLDRTAGPHCRHCPARIYCPEALRYASIAWLGIRQEDLKDTVKDETTPFIPTKRMVEKAIVELPRGTRGAAFWEQLKFGKYLIQTFETAYKAILLDDPDALPGYILPAEGHQRRTVAETTLLKIALADYVDSMELDLLADYPVAKIEELFGVKSGLAGKKLRTEFERLTAGSVTVTNDEPFIRPLTKKEKPEITQISHCGEKAQ